jgi:hypothetical protein
MAAHRRGSLAHGGDDVVLPSTPDNDVGRRFPNGWFRIAPLPGTKFERVGADELLFLDSRSRQQPIYVSSPFPPALWDCAFQGHLIAEKRAEAPSRLGPSQAHSTARDHAPARRAASRTLAAARGNRAVAHA